MDLICASCGYEITDLTKAGAVQCGHGIIHHNCSYFNKKCLECDSKFSVNFDIEFCPKEYRGDTMIDAQMCDVMRGLEDLNHLLKERTAVEIETDQIISELQKQIKMKDEKLIKLQKEIYELKLEKVDSMKKDLQDKIRGLSQNPSGSMS